MSYCLLNMLTFPQKFEFGWSQSGFQSEMGDENTIDDKSDWFLWTHDKENITSGLVNGDFPENGANYWNNYKHFHDNAVELGLNTARIGIEMSRIFPEKPLFDLSLINSYKDINIKILDQLDKYSSADALKHYIDIFEDLKIRNVKTILNLYHWSLPLWLNNPVDVRKGIRVNRNGWLNSNTIKYFALFASYIVYKMDKVIDMYSTMNEANILIDNGFINVKSGFPPSYLSKELSSMAINNILKAHSMAYDSMKQFTNKMIGIIHGDRDFTPLTKNDKDAVKKAEYDSRWYFFDSLIKGNEYLKISGKKLDWLGVNYYSRTVIQSTDSSYKPVPGYGYLCDKNSLSLDDRPTSDMGREFYPEGLYNVLLSYWHRYKIPMYVSENGIADEGDYQRPYYLVSHINSVKRALDEGADIIGYLHWSLVDNYEWYSGFTPKFGLIEINLNTKKLHWRSSAFIYREIAKSRSISDKTINFNSIPPLNGLRQ